MPFTFLIVGIVLLVSGVQNTQGQLFTLLQNDFSIDTQPSFTYWLLAILFIGSLGYVGKLRTFSRLFLVLVIIVLFIHNKGFFCKFAQEFYPDSTFAKGCTNQ